MSKIPKGWTEKKLKELLVECGKRNKKLEVTNVLSVSNKHGLTNPENLFGRRIASDEISNYKIISKGQFAYNPSRLLVGSLAIKEDAGDAVLSPLYVIFDTTNEIDKRFLFNWLFSEKTKQKFIGAVQGGVRDSVSYEALSELDIELPPLDEQKKIAEILTSIDRMIDLTSIEINKIKNLKEALEVDLFSKLSSNFNMLLGDFSRIAVGIVSGCTEEYTEKGVPFLRSQNIKQNRIDEENIIYISEEFNKKNKKSILAEGDVAIVRSGVNSGMASAISKKYAGANCFSLVIVKLDKSKCLPSYLSFFINSKIGQSYIQKFNFGSAQANFNVSEAVKMPVPLPPLSDQDKIVKTIGAFEQIIWSKIEILEKITNLKKGLMNDLFEGKVRVKI